MSTDAKQRKPKELKLTRRDCARLSDLLSNLDLVYTAEFGDFSYLEEIFFQAAGDDGEFVDDNEVVLASPITPGK